MSEPGTQRHEDVSTPESFTRFYRTHVATVYAYAMRLTGGDRSHAEDATQDAWLALTTELSRGRVECADIRWLLTATRNKVIDRVRREETGRRKLTLIASSREGHDASPPSSDEVLDVIASLDPVHRIVLVMRYVDGSPVSDIADAIGRTTVATYSLLGRARDEVRRLHGGFDE